VSLAGVVESRAAARLVRRYDDPGVRPMRKKLTHFCRFCTGAQPALAEASESGESVKRRPRRGEELLDITSSSMVP
jgi:hypothetical protein